MWHKIFVSFAVFPAICKNKLPQVKIITNSCSPEKIYSRVKLIFSNLTSLHKNTVQEIVSVQLQLVSFIQKQNGIQWSIGFT